MFPQSTERRDLNVRKKTIENRTVKEMATELLNSALLYQHEDKVS